MIRLGWKTQRSTGGLDLSPFFLRFTRNTLTAYWSRILRQRCSTVTPSPNHTEPVSEAKNGHGLSSGGIAGITVGCGAAVLVAAILLFFCGRRSRRNKHEPLPQSQYLGPKFTDGPHISNHETDVPRYSALQRVSMISQGSSPPHDFYR